MKKILFLSIILFCSGCKNKDLIRYVDTVSFSYFGTTLFSNPGQVTTKEVHFDSGNLLGQQVVMEGKLVTTGEYYTHLVISDDSGRMLVALTDISEAEEILKKGNFKRVIVLGTVERGKKGLPFIQAKSLKPVEATSKF